MDYDFRTFQFGSGAHTTRDKGMCIMEAVAYIAGEEHSDHPECASPVIAALLRRFNDSLNNERRRALLSQFVFRMVGTKSTPAIESERAWMSADWAIRVATPMFLELVPALVIHGKELRGLPPVTRETLAIATIKVVAARTAARELYWAAAAVAAAAVAAAVAEAEEAAAAVAAAVVAAAAVAAAVVAAAAVAAAVVAERALKTSGRTAARSNAQSRVDETVRRCQESCVDLVDRMIRLTEIEEVVPVKAHTRRKRTTTTNS